MWSRVEGYLENLGVHTSAHDDFIPENIFYRLPMKAKNEYPTQVWKYKRDCLKSNLHPTQKPLALCEDLIKTFSSEDDLVLDNCMGSNTTGLACMNTGRKFIGIEKDEKYFNISVDRIREAYLDSEK